MLTRIRHFFTAPVFGDPEKTRIGRLLNDMLQAVLALTIIAAVFLIAAQPADFFENLYSPAILLSIVLAVLLLRVLLLRGHTQLTSALLSLTFVLVPLFVTYYYGGITNSSSAGYLLCIIMAGLLLGGRGAMAFVGISLVALVGVWRLGQLGQLPDYPSTPTADRNYALIAYSIIFVVGGLLLRYAAGSIAQAMDQVRRREQAEAAANRELRELRDSLEQQVAERTLILERRTVQLQAAAQVGRTVTAVLETEQLAQQVVRLIRNSFALHQVGLFLIDESGEWAVLQASDGQASSEMLARGYRVPVHGESLVGQSIVNVQVYTATESIEAPEARAVVVLPLQSRQRMFGALAMYSREPGLFDQGTLAILESVADQVSIALDNAHLFAQSRAALEQAQRAYGEFSLRAWADLARTRPDLGKRKDHSGTFQVTGLQTPEALAALQTGRSKLGQEDKRELAAPIKVRENVIGVIDARKPGGSGEWTPEEIRLIESLAEQLGVALDSARLYQDTQRRAAREQRIGEIAARMRESLDMETVLRTTAEEMYRTFNLAEAEIRIGTGSVQAPGSPGQGATR